MNLIEIEFQAINFVQQRLNRSQIFYHSLYKYDVMFKLKNSSLRAV